MKNPYKIEAHRLAFDQAVKLYQSGVTDYLQISKQLDHSIDRHLRQKIAAKVCRLFYWQEQKIAAKIEPHKGGRTVTKNVRVTPNISDMIAHLSREHGDSLGDIVEEAVSARFLEKSTKIASD